MTPGELRRKAVKMARAAKCGGLTEPVLKHSPIHSFSKKAKQFTVLVERDKGRIHYHCLSGESRSFYGKASDEDHFRELMRHLLPQIICR